MYEMMGTVGAGLVGGGLAKGGNSHDGQCGIVIALIAQEKRVPIRLLMHKSRCRAGAARARHLAMYLCHVALGCSLQAVGEVFGRDRTTVSYACALIEDMRDEPAFDAELTALEQRIDAAIGGPDHGAR